MAKFFNGAVRLVPPTHGPPFARGRPKTRVSRTPSNRGDRRMHQFASTFLPSPHKAPPTWSYLPALPTPLT